MVFDLLYVICYLYLMERKTIPGYSKYSVTKDGKVFGVWGNPLRSYNSNGYRYVSIKKDGGQRSGISIHRLVAMTWIGPIPKGYWINHEDGNRANNNVENLKIGTPSYNHKHAFEILGRTPSNIATKERIELLKLLIGHGWSQNKIAIAFGCSQPNISMLVSKYVTSEKS